MEANKVVLQQKEIFENIFTLRGEITNSPHLTKDPLTRYLRDRRLKIAIDYIAKHFSVSIPQLYQWKVLIVCGGPGGEGIFFLNQGFTNVTTSDFSENALQVCRISDERLKTLQLNAEKLELADNSYDLVLVQDGLHHLSCPAQGFTEMLRVARKAVVVIEPHTGWVASAFGQEWEQHQDVVNYVFRWNQNILEQLTKSYLLKNTSHIKAIKVWDHTTAVMKLVNKFPAKVHLRLVKAIYGFLNFFLKKHGNNMVGIVIKP